MKPNFTVLVVCHYHSMVFGATTKIPSGIFTCALSEFCIRFDIEVKQEVPKADSDGLLVFISVRIS